MVVSLESQEVDRISIHFPSIFKCSWGLNYVYYYTFAPVSAVWILLSEPSQVAGCLCYLMGRKVQYKCRKGYKHVYLCALY